MTEKSTNIFQFVAAISNIILVIFGHGNCCDNSGLQIRCRRFRNSSQFYCGVVGVITSIGFGSGVAMFTLPLCMPSTCDKINNTTGNDGPESPTYKGDNGPFFLLAMI